MRLDGKVVLITGASEGIGAACAAAFRRRGALLALTARSDAKLRSVALNTELVVPADLLDHQDRSRIIEEVLRHYGRIDVLVNNAGAGLYAPAHTAPDEEARLMFELNFFAPLHLIRMAVPHMKQQQSGAIVNISSIAGKVTLPWFTLYSATKHSLTSLTDGLRMELRRYGIHCMAVHPGYVKTRFQQNVLAGKVPPALGGMRQRWAITPEECAEAVVKGLERNARNVVTPATGRILIALERLFPSVVHKKLEEICFRQETHA